MKMLDEKRTLKFSIEDTKLLEDLVEELTKLEIDMDLKSTPSKVEISLYGSESKVEESSEKIKNIFRDLKSKRE